MKKSLALLLLLAMIFTLSACVKVPPAADPVPVPPEPTAVTGALCAVLEGQRLYAFPKDGSPGRLLVDAYCHSFDRNGDMVVASFDDNTIRRIDLTTGENQILYTAPNTPQQVYWCDSGFVYLHVSMSSWMLYYYNEETDTCTEVTDNFYDHNVVGDTLYYCTHDIAADQEWYISLDLPSGTENWRSSELQSDSAVFEGQLYVHDRTRDDNNNVIDTLMTIDAATGVGTPVETPFAMTADLPEYISPHGYLIRSDDWRDGRLYFVTPDGTQTALPLSAGDNAWPQVYDVEDNIALLGSNIGQVTPVLDEHIYYITRELCLLDMTTGQVTPLDYVGENGKLFQSGDFPILDSSTARKPVTRSIYSLFCLDSGAGGAMPVCNTTHGAWLALADKTTDIALLAAPTADEQAYLTEKGVEVEMKLYGGDGLVFITNQACGVTDLTMDQVRAIYRGEVTNWSEVGGVDAPITVLYRDSQSGSQRLFERMVWTDEPMPDLATLGFKKEEEMSSIVNMVVADPYAIGYSIMTYLTDVYQEPDLVALSLDGAAPTPENVANTTYPMGTKGYVVIRSDEAADSPARRLYDWFDSPMADQILTQNGVTPLSE